VFDILIPWYLELYQVLISLFPLIFIIELLYGLSNVISHILFLLLTIEFIALDFGVSFGVWSLITNQATNASIEDI